MKRREMKLLLEERFERITLLETRIDTMDQLVEGYRVREQAILDTLQSAKENAARLLEQANAEAQQVRAAARGEADELLSSATAAAEALRDEAERGAVELIAAVKADSERMLRDAEIIKREYEELVDSFNAMLEQNASELQTSAARFAEFVKNRRIDTPEMRTDGDVFYKSVGVLSDAALPDASGDPARLMQNIYRIQNRPLPEDRAEPAAGAEMQAQTPAEDRPAFPIEDGSGADERQSAAAEPYSEAAWADEAQRSESEPQAEFTKAFDGAFAESEFVVRADGCHVTQADAAQAFDALFAAPAFAADAAAAAMPEAAVLSAAAETAQPQAEAERAFDEFFSGTLETGGEAAQGEAPPAQAAEPASPVPEPYSEAAWAHGAFTSDYEPQAEFSPAFGADVPAGEPAQTENPAPEERVSASEAARAFDDFFAASSGEPVPAAEPAPAAEYVPSTEAEPSAEVPSSAEAISSIEAEYAAELPSYAQYVPAAEPAPAAPEPYSEAAWAHGAFTSDYEPQAEGALFAVEPEAEEEPEPAPAPRRYNEYGEIREWEPEPEPEMGEVPTVSRYVGQSGGAEEISLDDLLDEIIKAGE